MNDSAHDEVPVHCFADDALGDLDATGVAERIRSREVSAAEVVDAAIDRALVMEPLVHAVHYRDYERVRAHARPTEGAEFSGVPTYVKDNVDVKGLPTNHGSRAFEARPAKKDSPFVRQFRALGVTVLGKSRLPEFGFSASAEYVDAAPVRNPWNPAYSSGASSGGSAALVASGVVPIAHANDGGGSIRIPAAACGLVGLKPTRGRLVPDHADKTLPVRVVTQGVLTRSVRDTANFYAAAEEIHGTRKLPRIGRVTGPSSRRLKVGLIMDSVRGNATDEETRGAVEKTAALLVELGHEVEPVPLPVSARFAEDFASYWGLLGLLISATGSKILDPGFDADLTDPLTQGLAKRCRQELLGTPGVLLRLKGSQRTYRKAFVGHDVLLSPVLAHTTPELGYLSPTLGFDELFERLQNYVGFTPLNNAAGGPAMSLPLGRTGIGLPIGVHFSADLGDERTLLELAFELEGASPWARIADAPRAVQIVGS